MEIFIFVPLRARTGNEAALEAALLEVVGPTRQEAGCISINAFHSTRDPLLYYIHSRWHDDAAFDLHATLPHTVRFIQQIEPLLDHPLQVTRAELIG